ncbi:MAG TPA: polysaccharide deacetylase, partial [Spirochaetes bacterium]|nr:polysaccharide deacetylase [Spirochaetota bacterium]
MNRWIKRLTGAAMTGAFVALFMTMGFALEGGLDRYDEYYALCTGRDGAARAALRSFYREGRRQILTVDPVDLRTHIVPSTDLICRELPFSDVRKELKGSPYAAAMADAEKNSRAVQNAGFSRYIPNQKGINLTADLCPSKAPLDRRLFLALINNFKDIQSPVPIALAVTGLWLETHGDDVGWLRRLERDGKITVLWINHSYHHRVKKKTPLRKNFLLSPGTVLDREILGTEKKMLEMGLLPSVFFRFPGLVSN